MADLQVSFCHTTTCLPLTPLGVRLGTAGNGHRAPPVRVQGPDIDLTRAQARRPSTITGHAARDVFLQDQRLAPFASTSRISSLYVFDAIARAARTAATGGGKDGKGKGKESAGALGLVTKLEGVVRELGHGYAGGRQRRTMAEGKVSFV